MTVTVIQGENEGGGSSGWLKGEVRERRLWEVCIKIREKDMLVGKSTKTCFVLIILYSDSDFKGSSQVLISFLY